MITHFQQKGSLHIQLKIDNSTFGGIKCIYPHRSDQNCIKLAIQTWSLNAGMCLDWGMCLVWGSRTTPREPIHTRPGNGCTNLYFFILQRLDIDQFHSLNV